MAVKKKVSGAAKKVMKKATKAAGKAKKAAGKAKKVVKKIAKGSARPKKGIKAAVAKRKAKKASKSKAKGKATMAAAAAAAGKKKSPGMYGANKGDYKEHMDASGHETKDGDVGGGKYGKGGHYKDYEGTGMYGKKAPGMYSGKKGAHMMDQPMMADSDRLEGAGSEGDPGLGRMSMGASMSSMSKHMKGGPLMSKYKVGTGGKKLR